MKHFVLSPSSIKLFDDCKRCFWLDKIKGIKRPSGITATLPSGMDRILKQHFDHHRKNKTLPLELEKLKGFLFPDEEKVKIWRNNKKGLRYLDSETGAELMGAIDDLFVTESGHYAPIDFKTRGYPLKENSHEHYRIQMNIYSLLLEKSNLPSAGFAIVLVYHPKAITKSCHVEFYAEPIKIKTSIEKGMEIFRKAIECLRGEEPERSKNCEWCRWEQMQKEHVLGKF